MTEFNLKHMCPVTSRQLHFAEVQCGPVLFHAVMPVHHLLADCAFISHARLEGHGRREIMLLSVFTHGAIGGEPQVLTAPTAPANWTTLRFDPLCEVVRARLLAIGMNPGGPKASLARWKPNYNTQEIKWEDLIDWPTSPREYKRYDELNSFERDLQAKIENSLMSCIIEDVLFAAGSRDFESLRLGILWIRETPPSNIDEETAAAVIRILLGRGRRWFGSGKEGRIEPSRVVKQYLGAIVAVSGETVVALTQRVEAILGASLTQWLVEPRTLILLAPRPDANSCVRVYACRRCGRTHLHRAAGVCTRCSAVLGSEPRMESVVGDITDFYEFLARCHKPEFRLNCAELTGQTDPDDRRTRQRLFQEVLMEDENEDVGGVDLLSVTTTMEAGVDIGSLQGLGLANMPPVRFRRPPSMSPLIQPKTHGTTRRTKYPLGFLFAKPIRNILNLALKRRLCPPDG